jgi:hypothetical protein
MMFLLVTIISLSSSFLSLLYYTENAEFQNKHYSQGSSNLTYVRRKNTKVLSTVTKAIIGVIILKTILFTLLRDI